ncbi:hypothetical protein [Candidatus Rickettsiella viridis]|nr:hypothetical protein [Candidatus Rickettsiella viridis]
MDLEQKIQASQTHDAAQINPAELVQELSTISMNLNIVAGICYFIIEDKNRNLTVYRHIFKEGLRNKKIQDFLAKEKESKINDQKMAVAIQIENNKTIKTHRIAFIKDFLAGLFTLGLTAFTTVGAITLCMLVIPLPYSLIAAAAASAIILPGIPLLYKKAIEKNKPTIEFAKTFTTKVLGADEIDSALPSALQADPTQGTFFHLISPTTVMPRKTEPTVLVRSFSDKRPFVNRLASINEEEEEKNKQPESSLGIYRH